MAAVTNYTTLKAGIADWLARGDLTDQIPQFIQNWEERFLRQPKNFGRWMEAALDGVIASSVLALPERYLGLKYAYVNISPASALDRVSLNQLYGRYPRNSAPDLPSWVARDLETFVFGPEPDSDYSIRGVYYKKPVLIRDFAADAAAHWIIINAPDLALYGALLQATPFLQNDKRILTWQTFYEGALEDYRDLHRDEDVSGSPLQEVLA
jgi:hypothetical protein